MSEPTRQQVLHALRERIAHLEIYRGRGAINARLHELESMRAALRELEVLRGEPEVLAVCREKLAAMMLRLSIPTGHGDTFDDLLRELEAALRERPATIS